MGTAPINHVGKRFGRLTVLAEAPPRPYRMASGKIKKNRYVSCRCECGRQGNFKLCQLISGHTRSCGCLSSELKAARNYKHGGKGKPEYTCWKAAIHRCHDPRSDSYRHYGARGIAVCDEWRADFNAFLNHIGPRPSLKHTLDRIDPNGNYEPGNVRWATTKQQLANRRVYCQRCRELLLEEAGSC